MLSIALVVHIVVVGWDFYSGAFELFEKWELGLVFYTASAVACIRWKLLDYKTLLIISCLLMLVRWSYSWNFSDPTNHFRNYSSVLLYSPLLVSLLSLSGSSCLLTIGYAIGLGVVPYFALGRGRFEDSVFAYPLAAPAFAISLMLLCYFMREWGKYKRNLGEVEELSAAKSRFFASMSHEIRTPMTAVLSFSDLILKEELNDETRSKVLRIKSATNSLLEIINDVLDMSKLEAGKTSIESVDFQPAELLADVIDMFSQQLDDERKRVLTLNCNLSPDFPDSMRGDVTRIRQVLVNLVGNAVKFTQEGEVTLKGACIDAADGGRFVRFEVTDTGIGISQEALPHLFEDYTQADRSMGRQFSGTGLGLSISKRLVHLFGGEIGLSSTLDHGSTFWFTVPFVEAHDIGAVSPRNDQGEMVVGKAKRSLRLLLAEDNELLQEALVHLVQGLGHSAHLVNNGEELLLALESQTFDLVISDVRMPGLSGSEAATRIRRMSGPVSGIPIVALTADIIVENTSSYLAAGMDVVLSKPIRQEDMARVINDTMGEEIHDLTPANTGFEDDEDLQEEISVGEGRGQAVPPSPFNVDEAIEKVGINEEKVLLLLNRFSADYDDVVDRIRSQIEVDSECVASLLHDLRGVSASLHLDRIREHSLALEAALQASDRAWIEKCLTNLAESVEQTIGEIRTDARKRREKVSG